MRWWWAWCASFSCFDSRSSLSGKSCGTWDSRRRDKARRVTWIMATLRRGRNRNSNVRWVRRNNRANLPRVLSRNRRTRQAWWCALPRPRCPPRFRRLRYRNPRPPWCPSPRLCQVTITYSYQTLLLICIALMEKGASAAGLIIRTLNNESKKASRACNVSSVDCVTKGL